MSKIYLYLSYALEDPKVGPWLWGLTFIGGIGSGFKAHWQGDGLLAVGGLLIAIYSFFQIYRLLKLKKSRL